MGYIVSIDKDCPGCGKHVGENYTTIENGQHTKASCSICGAYVKNLSKDDKYGTKEQQEAIWKKTRGRCAYCGDNLNPFSKRGYAYDHVIPQNSGGEHTIENQYPCCTSCNSQKNSKSVEEYRAYLMQKTGLPKYVFYFEALEFSKFGDILKAIF